MYDSKSSGTYMGAGTRFFCTAFGGPFVLAHAIQYQTFDEPTVIDNFVMFLKLFQKYVGSLHRAKYSDHSIYLENVGNYCWFRWKACVFVQ